MKLFKGELKNQNLQVMGNVLLLRTINAIFYSDALPFLTPSRGLQPSSKIKVAYTLKCELSQFGWRKMSQLGWRKMSRYVEYPFSQHEGCPESTH